MPSAFSVVRARALDVATVGALVVAVALMLQPGSTLRIAWNRHVRDVATAKVATSRWSDLTHLSASFGQDAADAQVVEISDYECPYCRRAEVVVDSAVHGGLRVVFLNDPLPIHQHARGAAIAALCAERAGRFREMHSRLMTSAQWQSDSNWTREAQVAGVTDLQAFGQCIHDPTILRRLADQMSLAESLRVVGTPTFVSKGRVHRGVPSMSELLSLVPTR